MLLLVSVIVPGSVLAWYSVQAVLWERSLYEAAMNQHAGQFADSVQADLAERIAALLAALDAGVDREGDAWIADPRAAATRLAGEGSPASEVLLLDERGIVLHPQGVAGIELRPAPSLPPSLEPILAEGTDLELRVRDWEGAAAAYARALPLIRGERGRGIAKLAQARCLLKASRPEEALAVYDDLATTGAGLFDRNGFPIDALALLQASLALSELRREGEAAGRLARLVALLRERQWTFGGRGEAALARRALDGLSTGLAERLPEAERLDVDAVRRDLDLAAARQADEAAVMAALASGSAGAAGPWHGGGGFALHPVAGAGHDVPVAWRRWSRGGELRLFVLPLDRAALNAVAEASLAAAGRASPEFVASLVASRPGPRDPAFREPGELTRSLGGSFLGLELHVYPGEAARAWARPRQEVARLGMIAALLLVIVVGLSVIARGVAREVEIARLKSDFVSGVSHELRTPLTTIRIMGEMLALGAVPAGEKQAEYHRNIVSEAERLTRLINNVLDFARIEEGRKKFSFGMGDVGDTVYEVERITGDYARKEGFALTTAVEPGLPPTAFDRDAIVQALINLMSNAIKYGRDDKRIEMGARMQRDSIVLWVQDHGPGIDAREMPRIFEKFYRGGDHMTRQVGGTGLGLSIVKHIVAAHGGSVNVQSRPGEGARFEIVLPVCQASDLDSVGNQR